MGSSITFPFCQCIFTLHFAYLQHGNTQKSNLIFLHPSSNVWCVYSLSIYNFSTKNIDWLYFEWKDYLPSISIDNENSMVLVIQETRKSIILTGICRTRFPIIVKIVPNYPHRYWALLRIHPLQHMQQLLEFYSCCKIIIFQQKWENMLSFLSIRMGYHLFSVKRYKIHYFQWCSFHYII